MKELSYVLLFDNDLITSSVLALSLHKHNPESSVYKASSTLEALNLLQMMCEHEDQLNLQQEACFIVDLNMSSLEGYLFLASLEQFNFNNLVRVYVLNDESRPNSYHLSMEHYHIAGYLKKPLNSDAVERVWENPSPKYFQKRKEYTSPSGFFEGSIED